MRPPTDNRRVLVGLTPKGRQLARLLHPHIRRYNDLVCHGLGAAELRALRGALDKIYENFVGMDERLPDFPDFEPAESD
jgi:DNA-binding MarR family transcriptional regulator